MIEGIIVIWMMVCLVPLGIGVLIFLLIKSELSEEPEDTYPEKLWD